MTEEISEEMKKLVIARIDARMPSTIKMSIGSSGSLSKKEMIDHVQKMDETGRQIVKMHFNFIKAVASGKFLEEVKQV